MPALEFTVPHQLEPEEVVGRMKGFLAKLREQNEPRFLVKREEWQENTLHCSFSSFGFAMDAITHVRPSDMNFKLTIPFAALIFKGQIEDRLRGELTKVLT